MEDALRQAQGTIRENGRWKMLNYGDSCNRELVKFVEFVADLSFSFSRTENKKRASYFHRTAQPSTLAPFPAWGIQQELVVKDLPAAKVTIILVFQ